MTLLDLKANDKLVEDIIKVADEFYEEDAGSDSGFTKETLFHRDSPMLPIIKAALRKSRVSKGNKSDILLEEISKELRKPYRFGDKSSSDAMDAIIKQSDSNRDKTFQYVLLKIMELANSFRENEGFNPLVSYDVYSDANLKRLVDAIFTAVVTNSKTMMEVPYPKVDSMVRTPDIKKMVEEFALLI